MVGKIARDLAHGDLCRLIEREAVDTRADGREIDRMTVVFARKAQAVAVAIGQQLRLAVQESPEFVDAWFELARLLEADRQFSEANEIYNSLIEQDPDNPDIWIRMVEGQIRAGKGQKALDYALNGPATYGY